VLLLALIVIVPLVPVLIYPALTVGVTLTEVASTEAVIRPDELTEIDGVL